MKVCSRLMCLSIAGALLLVIGPASVTAHAQSGSTAGAVLYKAKCAMCHGADGAGKTPMGQKLNIRDLHSADVQKQADAVLSQIIAQGKGKMPAFGQKLTEDQIKLLVAQIRELGNK